MVPGQGGGGDEEIMKQDNQEIERYRVTPSVATRKKLNRRMASTSANGNNGMFLVPIQNTNTMLICMASDGAGWEHVSVSCWHKKRVPSWEEMCFIKDLFWGDDEVVIQYHPRRQDYVNNHEYCLHMWRPTNQAIPTPPTILVGIK